MHKRFIEYMKDFLDEDSSPDFWYDVACEDARKLLLLFTDYDWLELIKELDFQPVEFKRKLAYCLDDGENPHQLRVLLLLTNAEDKELLEICIDSLRDFMNNNNNIKLISQNKLLIDYIKQALPHVGIATKKVYGEFLSNLVARYEGEDG